MRLASRPTPARRRMHWAFAILAFGAAFAFGCSDSTGPSTTDTSDENLELTGSINPAEQTFLIDSDDANLPPERHGRFLLIGSNPVVDAEAQTVSFDVRIRNASRDSAAAPLIAWVSRLRPAAVTVANTDLVDSLPGGGEAVRFGFDYSASLGEDGVLAPAEESEARGWTFHDPELLPFTFAARIQAGELPEPPAPGATIAGRLFLDRNRNALADSTEPGLHAMIVMRAPGGEIARTHTDRAGVYRFAIRAAGWYELRCEVPPRLPGEFTTPNPLQVVVVADAEGRLQSVRGANFGFGGRDSAPAAPPVVMTARPLDDFSQDSCRLLDAQVRGDLLLLRVGYSGCRPDHPFAVYISTAFAESMPVQTRALLVHDDRDELCDQAFENPLRFRLAPLRDAYLQAYGRPGVIVIHLSDFNGVQREVRYRMAGCDSLPPLE
ncbi:MAG: hypothetical protein KBD56_03775 [Candidatus Eisenbacteria bacterium]|nr:hypothetical protein [Candidatus Eisenbacteria bacterium]